MDAAGLDEIRPAAYFFDHGLIFVFYPQLAFLVAALGTLARPGAVAAFSHSPVHPFDGDGRIRSGRRRAGSPGNSQSGNGGSVPGFGGTSETSRGRASGAQFRQSRGRN